MNLFEIADLPDQQFATVFDGQRVTIRLRYNVTWDRWSLDLSIDDLPVLQGRKIVTGVDLLKPFNLGVGIIFAAAVTPGAVPNKDSLPNGTVRIYQTTEDEINAAIS